MLESLLWLNQCAATHKLNQFRDLLVPFGTIIMIMKTKCACMHLLKQCQNPNVEEYYEFNVSSSQSTSSHNVNYHKKIIIIVFIF